jgi:hypothetical protein
LKVRLQFFHGTNRRTTQFDAKRKLGGEDQACHPFRLFVPVAKGVGDVAAAIEQNSVRPLGDKSVLPDLFDAFLRGVGVAGLASQSRLERERLLRGRPVFEAAVKLDPRVRLTDFLGFVFFAEDEQPIGQPRRVVERLLFIEPEFLARADVACVSVLFDSRAGSNAEGRVVPTL